MNLENIQPTEYQRHFESKLLSRLHENLPFIQVIIGPRQVGKTTGVKSIFNSWERPKLFISADDPTPKSPEWLAINWQQARSLGHGTLFVVDEIQKVTGWAEVVKKLYDEDRPQRALRVVLLGSASLSIRSGLAAALAGRFEVIHVPHWSFAEFHAAFGWSFDQYQDRGGYPAIALLGDNNERWRTFMLNSNIEPVLGRDIAGTIPIAKPALFRQTFELAVQLPCRVVSYNKLLGQMQEGGNTTTVRQYLEMLEGAFLLKLLSRYAGGAIKKKASSPKIVPLAPALSQAYRPQSIASNDPTWNGYIFESIVGAMLAQLPGNLFYWAEGDYEVDYVREFDGRLLVYEVKSGRTRKAKSLEQFLRRFPHAEVRIVTREDLMTGKNSLD